MPSSPALAEGLGLWFAAVPAQRSLRGRSNACTPALSLPFAARILPPHHAVLLLPQLRLCPALCMNAHVNPRISCSCNFKLPEIQLMLQKPPRGTALAGQRWLPAEHAAPPQTQSCSSWRESWMAVTLNMK